MFQSFLQTSLLKEGRSIRVPILLIFYNSILAFVTILFIFFNNESMQVGYYTGNSSYFTQFLIISSLQILAVFLMNPFTISYMEETECHVARQFVFIPEVIPGYILSRVFVLLLNNLLIFISSLPIISLCCIYSGISLLKLGRLLGMILIFSFWSGSIAIFFYSIQQKLLVAFAGTIFTYFMFSVGIMLFLEVVKNYNFALNGTGIISTNVVNLCLFLNLFNPLVVYMGYFGNLSGSVSMVISYFGNYGIDATRTKFAFLYYKAATITCILTGILFLYLSIRFFSREKRI